MEQTITGIFSGLDREGFEKTFSKNEDCLKFLAEQKWSDGFVCRKCGNDNYCQGRRPYSRRCTRCKHEESATSHTAFHGCHIDLRDAFRMVYDICNDQSVSTYKLAGKYNIRQMTCWRLKKKILSCEGLIQKLPNQ